MENPENREEKALVFAPNTCPLSAHSSKNGGIWGHGQGGMPFFFSDPLLKGRDDVGEEYPCKRVFDFLFVCLEAETSLRAMRPTNSDAKLMGGGWT